MGRVAGARGKARLEAGHHQDVENNSWFQALEILDESNSQYLVRWAGIDPSTGNEWEPSWV